MVGDATLRARSGAAAPRLFLFALLIGCVCCDGSAAEEVKTQETAIFFPTCAYLDEQRRSWVVPLHVWLFRPDESSRARRFALETLRRAIDIEPTRDEEPVFTRRAWPFVVDNVDGREISVEIGGDFVLLGPTAENGHALGEVRLSTAEAAAIAQKGWLTYRADTADGDDRVLQGTVQLLPPRGVSVVSDIDDTIKLSQVADRQELLSNTFLRPMEPVPGMPALYRRWADDGAALHYVTASPWQLFVPLDGFRAAAGYPAGSFDMQLFRFKDRTAFNLFTDPDKLKRSAIERLFRNFPRRQFILVGDSGEHDPELYAEFARRYPGQVIGIYIRNVTRETAGDERFQQVFSGLPPALWRLFNDPIELNNVLIPEAGGSQ